ncbi:hypothetical protein A2U01_0069210, partial [Trifolium medium]|nr:hypothetical protein [Trifolium medium]
MLVNKTSLSKHTNRADSIDNLILNTNHLSCITAVETTVELVQPVYQISK